MSFTPCTTVETTYEREPAVFKRVRGEVLEEEAASAEGELLNRTAVDDEGRGWKHRKEVINCVILQ